MEEPRPLPSERAPESLQQPAPREPPPAGTSKQKPADNSLAAALPDLMRLARGVLHQRQSAEDVAQEACLAALQSPERPSNLGTWLADAVRRLASKVRRSDRRRRERERRAARPEAQPSAAHTTAELEVLKGLHDAVDRLQEPYRTAIRLRYMDDLPPRAIASELGQPVNTVKAYIRRGLEDLRMDVRMTWTRDTSPAADFSGIPCIRNEDGGGVNKWHHEVLHRPDQRRAQAVARASAPLREAGVSEMPRHLQDHRHGSPWSHP